MIKFDPQNYLYPSKRNVVYARNGMCNAGNPHAASAGLQTLLKGGNAVDAAVAMASAMPVVEPTGNGLGADCFVILWYEGKMYGLNASGPAPKSLSVAALKDRGFEKIPSYGVEPVDVPGVLPLEKVWFRLLFTILLLIGSYGCFCKYQQKSKTVEACKQWTKSRMFYHSGAYQQAVESYAEIQKEMKGNARFMFEYGHALHKLHKPEISNKVLKEALKVSGDPMILNIIGKNEQEMKHYDSAEYWFMRAVHRLPGRIYPYYLLAHLYAEPAFYQCDKLEQMVQTVLEKEPKVQSTAIKQMRRKARELLKKVPEN